MDESGMEFLVILSIIDAEMRKLNKTKEEGEQRCRTDRAESQC